MVLYNNMISIKNVDNVVIASLICFGIKLLSSVMLFMVLFCVVVKDGYTIVCNYMNLRDLAKSKQHSFQMMNVV